MTKNVLIYCICCLIFLSGCSDQGRKKTIILKSGESLEETFTKESVVAINIGPVSTEKTPALLEVGIFQAKTAGSLPIISDEKWNAPEQGISILDKDALVVHEHLIEGWSIVSLSDNNEAAFIIWRPRNHNLNDLSISGIYDAYWKSPLKKLKKGENLFFFDKDIRVIPGDVLGLFIYRDIPRGIKNQKSRWAHKYYRVGVSDTIDTSRDITDIEGAISFLPFYYKSIVKKSFNVKPNSEQIIKLDIPPSSSKLRYYKIQLTARNGNLKLSLDRKKKIYQVELLSGLYNYPKQFYWIGAIILLLSSCLIAKRNKISFVLGVLLLIIGIGLLFKKDSLAIFAYFISYGAFWAIPVLVLTAWVYPKVSKIPLIIIICANHIIWAVIFFIIGKFLFLFNASLIFSVGIILSIYILLLFIQKNKIGFILKNIVLEVNKISFTHCFLLIAGMGIIFLVWSQPGLWQRYDFASFSFVAIVNKILYSGLLSAGNFDPYMGPPIIYRAPYIQNPLIFYHIFLTYISRVDPNVVFLIASLICAWIWCVIAGGFAWIMYPQNSRIIVITIFFASIYQIFNWLFKVPYFVHNANPGPTGLFFVMASVFFHMAFHDSRQRWMLIFSIAALVAGLFCHFGYIIFAMIYWGIASSHCLINYFKNKKLSLDEAVFLLLWIPILGIFYLLIPKNNIAAGASFKMGTFYASYYTVLLGHKIANPKVIYSWKGIYWLRNIGCLLVAFAFIFRYRQCHIFVKYLAVAAFLLPILYFSPGIPEFLVATISEVGFIRLNNEWNEFFIILSLIVMATGLDYIVNLIRLSFRQKQILAIAAVVCVLGIVIQTDQFLPPNRYNYIQTFKIGKMPIIKYLKKHHANDLLITETLRAYWMGAQLPSYVYAYMVGRLRTNFNGAEKRVDENEKIWRHEGQPEEIAARVKNLMPAIILLSIHDNSYVLFSRDKEFKIIYNDGKWAIFSLKDRVET